MMVVPKELRSMSSIEVDHDLQGESSYWFTYKNSLGERMKVFASHIEIDGLEQNHSLPTGEIQSIDMAVPTKTVSRYDELIFDLGGKKVKFTVDTGAGHFHDIYALHKALKRRILLDRAKTR